MNIKVCGITQFKQLQQLERLDIDFAGFIFYKSSPRYVGDKISKKEIKSADFDIKKVGVFVNPEYDEVMTLVNDYDLDVVQLHGDEMPLLCEQISQQVEVIKAFRIGAAGEKTVDYMVQDYDEVCDYYLFDTSPPAPLLKQKGVKETYGGTGTQFDWEQLNNSKIEKPFFLSGGIGLGDVTKLKAFKHPDYYGVDVNSKFETAPGVKDMTKVLKFIMELKGGRS